MKLISLVALALHAPNTEFAWRCDVVSRQVCLEGDCQPSVPNNAWIVLYPSQQVYFRCGPSEDFGECDMHRARVSTSGIFLTMEIPGAGAFARVDPELRFVEVTALGLSLYAASGRCASYPPPLFRFPTEN